MLGISVVLHVYLLTKIKGQLFLCVRTTPVAQMRAARPDPGRAVQEGGTSGTNRLSAIWDAGFGLGRTGMSWPCVRPVHLASNSFFLSSLKTD